MKMFKGKIELEGDYKLEIHDDWFEVYDSKGNRVYSENSDGYWSKKEYDSKSNEVYYENSTGYWCKSEYDGKDNEVYFEGSDGRVIDNRVKKVKELSVKDISKLLGYEVKIVK